MMMSHCRPVNLQKIQSYTVMVTPGVPGTATECGRRVLVVVVHIWYHKNRYVTDVLPLLPLLPPVNSSQGASQVLAFTEGVILTIYGR